MSKTTDRLKSIVEPIVADAGFAFINIEFSTEFGRKALVLTIDAPGKEGGVSAQDCKIVAKKINPIDPRE